MSKFILFLVVFKGNEIISMHLMWNCQEKDYNGHRSIFIVIDQL